MWTSALEAHIEELRKLLLLRPDLWPMIAAQAGIALSTVQGFARNYSLYRNPTLSTLHSMSDAYDLVSQEIPDAF